MKIRKYLILSLTIIALAVLLSGSAMTQSTKVAPQDQLSKAMKSAIIEKVVEIFDEYYPLPDVASDMIEYVREKYGKGEYSRFDSITDLTAQLTTDLRFVSNDLHIRISPYEKLPDDLAAEIKLGSPDDNYGFHKVERLPGNIGYLELTSFNNPRNAAPTAVAAMNFVAHCDALIIDLRLNGGGDEIMAQFLSSYFFEESTHLTDVYIRKDDKTEQVWSQEWVPGPKMTDIPIYILMSSFSYSSSEAFAYQLQQLGRAVIIGARTKGGAHAVRYMSFPELSVNMKVPYTRDINPYSKTNYIDGVIPDIETTAGAAFAMANIEACRKLLATEKNDDKRYELEWVLAGFLVELNPVILEDAVLSEYVGLYDDVQFTLECRKLIYHWKDTTRHSLLPMGEDQFMYEEPDKAKYRVQFVRNDMGRVVEFYEHDRDGDSYPAKKRTGD